MIRALLLIGVAKTQSSLTPLQATVTCVQRMAEWGRSQTFQSVDIVTDEKEPVTVDRLKKTVNKILSVGNVSQLVVYFSGHGLNIAYNEFWLLSDFPTDSQAAVNLSGTDALARHCSVPHVVFISDACRTAADTIAFQHTRGSEIFPNRPPIGPDKSVDCFFATLLGAPALEVKDASAETEYSGIYTDLLYEALTGKHKSVLDHSVENGALVSYARPWPLKKFLTTYLGQRGILTKDGTLLSQIPDARITSEPTAWISRVIQTKTPATRGTASEHSELRTALLDRFGKHADTHIDLSQRVLEALAGPKPKGIDLVNKWMSWATEVAGISERFRFNASDEDDANGPFAGSSGLRVSGAEIQRCLCPHYLLRVLDSSHARIEETLRGAANALVVLKSNAGVVVPIIPNYICHLAFQKDELVHIAYQPSKPLGSYKAHQRASAEIREVLASQAYIGTLQIPQSYLDMLQMVLNSDPMLGLYAAYSGHRFNRRTTLQTIRERLSAELGVTFFDLALLLGESRQEDLPNSPDANVYPFYPMLSEGWSLLNAFKMNTELLERLRSTLIPSFWSVFDSQGVRVLEKTLYRGI